MTFRIVILLLALGLTFLIPWFFDDLLFYMVINFGTGWVFTTFFIRFLVILMLTIALKYLFSFWSKTAKLKIWVIFLIALLPGFGISFIAPIYQGDYGLVQYETRPLNFTELEAVTNGKFQKTDGYEVIAFFDQGCPHCKRTSFKLGVNIAAGQTTPVTAFFPGDESTMKRFLEENNGSSFSSYVIPDAIFVGNAGIAFPSTFLVDKDGNTINHWTGDVVNYSTLDYLLDLR